MKKALCWMRRHKFLSSLPALYIIAVALPLLVGVDISYWLGFYVIGGGVVWSYNRIRHRRVEGGNNAKRTD